MRGYDFVDGDRHPNDQNGHGTHVSGTIAQSTDNGIAAAGIAYRAKIMPVRVLDADGAGDTFAIARGIRYAARHRAKVINLSLEFDSSVRASQIPDIVSALRYARRKGVLVVARRGQPGRRRRWPTRPARASVLAVAATTIRGCQADYSNSGRDVDIAAPGGGLDAANCPTTPTTPAPAVPSCSGRSSSSRPSPRACADFGLPRGYEGTSMAAPHVSGVAALVIATKRLGAEADPGRADAPPRGHRARHGPGRVRQPLRQRPAGRRRGAALSQAACFRSSG